MPDVLTTGSVVAGYRIARLIGRGATGAVYLADDAQGQQVALKVLIPELARNERFRERFLREARIAASLEEPHVVPTLATGEEDGELYLVMRFVDGLDLREILKREGPLKADRAVDLVAQIASALDSAHARGLVHRDVKPGNVLIHQTETGEHAYLCDFGLARHLASVDSLTGERALVGTIAYISPEQIQGAPIDARTDVYSLGCLLFECLTGRAPFERESEVATVYAHMNEPPPRPGDVRPGIPAGFDDVVGKALEKAPGRPLRELRRARPSERSRAPRRTAPSAADGAIGSHSAPWRQRSGGRGSDGRHRPHRRRWEPRAGPTRDRAQDTRASSTPRPTRSSDASRLPASRGTSSSVRTRRGCCSATSAASLASTSRRTRCSRRPSSRSRPAVSRPMVTRPG